MEFTNKIISTLKNASNNNTLINVCLVVSFAALSARSMKQEKEINALAAEKETLLESNKALKKTMWDWKQQLLAEASTDSALVSLARIKAIYGDALTPPPGDVTTEDANSQASKFVI